MTNQFQPPEGLRDKVVEKILADWWPAGDYEAADRESVRTTAADVLAALFEACEVREDRRIVIDDEQVTGVWMSAELAARLDSLAAKYASGRVERRLVIGTEPEPVSSTEEAATR